MKKEELLKETKEQLITRLKITTEANIVITVICIAFAIVIFCLTLKVMFL